MSKIRQHSLQHKWKPDDLIVWYHQPRGGYAYVHVVPGVVVKATDKRITIAVRKTDGFVVERSVSPGAIDVAVNDVNVSIAHGIRESLQPRLKLAKEAK